MAQNSGLKSLAAFAIKKRQTWGRLGLWQEDPVKTWGFAPRRHNIDDRFPAQTSEIAIITCHREAAHCEAANMKNSRSAAGQFGETRGFCTTQRKCVLALPRKGIGATCMRGSTWRSIGRRISHSAMRGVVQNPFGAKPPWCKTRRIEQRNVRSTKIC